MRSLVILVACVLVATMGCSASTPQTEVGPQPSQEEVPTTGSNPRPWLENERPLVETPSTDIPFDGGEALLLPFSFDPVPIETWRYDACVSAGECRERVVPQPSVGPDEPAVGMRWEDANGYCITRGLTVQSQLQAIPIWTTLEPDQRRELLRDVDAEQIVTAGFHCVRVHE